jgi:glycosyltransferase involved in cell wall biosynthesis
MPVRDDWSSAAELIRRIDSTLRSHRCAAEILLVDDGSNQKCDPSDFQDSFSAVRSIRVLRLRRNLGHQRAIAIGLAHIQVAFSCDAVVVMDADGEDTPEGLIQLLSVYSDNKGAKAVFAQRARRLESFQFQLFYHLYRILHRMLTGINVRVGNFSILPAEYLGTLVALSELWNHYAAAVFRSKLPYTMTPIARGPRIAGKSSMTFVALVSHGLSAISVFSDVVGVRLLVVSLVGSLLALLGLVVVVAIRIFTNLAIPGWATYAAGALIIITVQFITMATSFTFFMLSSRANLGFVPLRDYLLFTMEEVTIYSHE